MLHLYLGGRGGLFFLSISISTVVMTMAAPSPMKISLEMLSTATSATVYVDRGTIVVFAFTPVSISKP